MRQETIPAKKPIGGGNSAIVDVHGHYTTVPKAPAEWRNRQITSIKHSSAQAIAFEALTRRPLVMG